jgi:hypothetical protein
MPRKEWTRREDTIIRRHYATKGSVVLAATLGRTKLSIQHRALRLGVPGGKRRWHVFEIRYLRANFGKRKTRSIARTLKRTHESVTAMIVHLKIGPRTMREWTNSETLYLREQYHRTPVTQIMAALNRTQGSVEGKAELEGLRHRHPRLTERQEAWVKENFGTIPFNRMAEKCGVNVSTIRHLAKKSGFVTGFTRREWTGEEDALLKESWHTISRHAIAEKLNRTVPSTCGRAKALGLTIPRRRAD